MTNSRAPALTIYGRPYCHLCEDMVEALRARQARWNFTLEVVDVDQDEELERRFGLLVPVLMADGREICHYHLDAAALEAFLEASLHP